MTFGEILIFLMLYITIMANMIYAFQATTGQITIEEQIIKLFLTFIVYATLATGIHKIEEQKQEKEPVQVQIITDQQGNRYEIKEI